MRRGALLIFVMAWALLFAARPALAQNPVPFLNQPLVPSAVAPGGPDFTLTVNGTGFVNGATVNWNGTPLATNFISGSQLTATVPAADIAGFETASVTVTNPAPGGGTSNAVPIQVAAQIPTPIVPVVAGLYGTSLKATAVIAGDFNGDGITDLAVSGSSVSVHLGKGDGSFSSSTSYALPGVATNIVTGDFNGDGRPDLAVPVTDNGSSYVYVFLGNWDGTFQDPIISSTTTANALVAGDFNGDGKLDLAQADVNAAKDVVLLGNGDGTFQLPVSSGSGTLGTELVAGDFDGDGKLDLAAFGFGGCYQCYTGRGAFVALGNGDGTFNSATEYGSFAPERHGITGDFNHDGYLDLAATETYFGSAFAGSAISALLGIGDGSFGSGGGGSPGCGPAAIAEGDFDADGNLDLVTVGMDFSTTTPGCSGQRYLSVLQGDGSGSFKTNKIAIPQFSYATSMAVGDFDRDGYLDFATVQEGEQYLSIILQQRPLSISPGVVDFRDQLVKAARSQDITLTNNTSTPVSITGMNITGANAADFSQTNTCGTSLAQGSCKITVTFTPGALGPRAASLVITDSGPGGSQTVPLTGTGVNPIVMLSATSLDFGSQPLTIQTTKSVTLSVSGNGDLTPSSITASGEFIETNNCFPKVANGASCTINVTFNPTTEGLLTGQITITDDAGDSPQSILLSGTGVPPVASLSSTNLDFGNQPVGVASGAQVVTITNNGPGPLLVTGITVNGTNAGDFTQTNTCLGTISFPGSCTISVTFTPQGGALRYASISVADDAADSPQTISASGTGVLPTATQSAYYLNFSDQKVGSTSAAQTVTITNTGAGPLAVSSVSFSGTNAGDFSETDNCTPSVAASASCTVNVTFKPGIDGHESATMTVNDNAQGGPQLVMIGGTGLAPVASLSPAYLTFMNATAGTPTAAIPITLSNTGGDTLNISNFLITPSFSQTNNCPAALPAGQQCTISVIFTAGSSGLTFGELIVSDNALGSAQQTVPLAGIAPEDVGSQPVEKATGQIGLKILNERGSGPVSILDVSVTGDFQLSSNPCGAILPGAYCNPLFTFLPQAGGTRTGTMVITDSSAGSPHVVPLSGTGEDFAFSIAPGSSSTATVNAGGTATYALTLTSLGKGSWTLDSFNCTGLPDKSTCMVSPGSVTFDPANPGTVTVTVATTAPSMLAPDLRNAPRAPFGQAGRSPRAAPFSIFQFPVSVFSGFQISNFKFEIVLLLSLALILASVALLRRRNPNPAFAEASAGRTQSRFPVLAALIPNPQSLIPVRLSFAALLLLFALLSWPGCGNGPAPAPPTFTNPGTPAGTYNLTVVGRNAGGSMPLEHSITLTLKVK